MNFQNRKEFHQKFVFFRMRHNQIVLEQEGQLNAPDPRETHPPCYADAILMPKPLSSLSSLKQAYLSSNDSINSARRATKRSRSEEQLDDDGSNKNRRILAARSQKDRLRNSIAHSVNASTGATGLVNNNPVVVVSSSQKSLEIITQLETSDGHSPYAKRRPHLNSETTTKIHSSCESLNEPIYANGHIAAGPSHHRSEISLTESEIPQASRSFSSFTTSSTSSFDSDEYYIGLYNQEKRETQQSEV